MTRVQPPTSSDKAPFRWFNRHHRLPLFIALVVVMFTIVVLTDAATTDQRIYPPYVAVPMTAQTFNVNQAVTYNGYYNIPCTYLPGDTTNNPQWSATNLPAGLGINATSGLVTGNPIAAGTPTVTIQCTNNSGSISTAAVWTIAAGTVAVGYFVDCAAGNDSAAGTSHTTAWRTLSKVSATAKPVGADVWIKAGTTCQPASGFAINWSGTAGDRVVVGSYYVSGGVAFQLLPSNYGPTVLANDYTWAQPRAIIQGSYQPSCRVWPSQCAFVGVNGIRTGVSGPVVPSNVYGFLVSLTGRYQTVQSLDVRDSAGGGIVNDGFALSGLYPSKGQVSAQSFNTIQYNVVSHTAYQGLFWVSAIYGVVRGNVVNWNGLSKADNQIGAADGGSLYVVHCDPCHAVIENNFFHDDYNETIGIGDASFVLFRGNLISNSQRVDIYPDGAADVLSEQNMALGGIWSQEPGLGPQPCAFTIPGNTGDPAQCPQSGNSAMNIIKEPENLVVNGSNVTQIGTANDATLRLLYRNNLVANYNTCFGVGISAGGNVVGVSGGFVGNTCVGLNATKRAADYTQDQGVVIQPGPIYTTNNILAVLSGTPICTALVSNGNSAVMPFNHNAWTGTPTHAGCKGTGDIYTTFAALALPPFAHFGDADKRNIPVAADFRPAANSTAASGALPTAFTYLDITAAGWQWEYSQMTWYPSCGTGIPSPTEWAKLRTTDYCGVAWDGATIGAINHN